MAWLQPPDGRGGRRRQAECGEDGGQISGRRSADALRGGQMKTRRRQRGSTDLMPKASQATQQVLLTRGRGAGALRQVAQARQACQTCWEL